MNKIEKILQSISARAVLVCAVISLAWVFVFATYIISRLFRLGWTFVEELTGYWLVLVAYVPLAYALTTETHIRVDFIISRLPEKMRRVWLVCTDIFGLILVAYLLGRAIEWVIHGIQYGTRSSASLNILLWPIYSLAPLGLTLFTLMFMLKISRDVLELIRAKRQVQTE